MKKLEQDGQGRDFLYLGYPMHLTPTELCIVKCLTDHLGCCQADAFCVGSAATVSVHVCAINKKAQIIGGRRLIQMIRGRGYRLCDDI